MACLQLLVLFIFSSCLTEAADPDWGDWGPFTKCSKTCGCGWKIRFRDCKKIPEALGGPGCNGSSAQLEKCNDIKCPEHGEWGPFGACSCSCGGGVQIQTRPCNLMPKSLGGPGCTHSQTSRTRECNTQPCITSPSKPAAPNPPVNGGWSDFSSWSKCTKTCGGGVQERSRTCTNPPPANGGKGCSGESKETKACGTAKCCIIKTKSGKCCALPFIYKGVSHSKCIVPTNGNPPWCSTTANYDVDKKWDECLAGGCLSGVQTKTGECCVFPFQLNGKNRFKCVVPINGNSPWCATTANYDKDKKWGVCKTTS